MRVLNGMSWIAKFATITGVMLIIAGPVVADLPTVQFDYTSLRFYYSGGDDRGLQITDTLSSTATIVLTDGSNLLGGPSLILGGSVFDVVLDVQVGTSADNYAMQGTFMATDIYGTRINGAFASSEVSILNGFQDMLMIEGVLTGIGDEAILVGDGPDWSYQGSLGTSVTMSDYSAYKTGELFQLTFGVGGSTLEELFDNSDQDGGTGIMHGSIHAVHVPAPAAIALGMVGLGLVGCWMRKHT